ncbi:hypothetical protein GCM10011352_06320 [Marinobacterium zhoushanense]|uniref:Uncharacterized protein n=1 Tax=Marinobacterium zhoushanense TaxID=1679163 RepID=A0ABQ1K2I3_9GAMM|nr:hypothetical protein GCM10011352_06320 [Marinobacterium zhoushanense]
MPEKLTSAWLSNRKRELNSEKGMEREERTHGVHSSVYGVTYATTVTFSA